MNNNNESETQNDFNLFNPNFRFGSFFTDKILDKLIWSILLAFGLIAWDLYGPGGLASGEHRKAMNNQAEHCPEPCMSTIEEETTLKSCPSPCADKIEKTNQQITQINKRLEFIQSMIANISSNKDRTTNGIFYPYYYPDSSNHSGFNSSSPPPEHNRQENSGLIGEYSRSDSFPVGTIKGGFNQPTIRKPEIRTN